MIKWIKQYFQQKKKKIIIIINMIYYSIVLDIPQVIVGPPIFNLNLLNYTFQSHYNTDRKTNMELSLDLIKCYIEDVMYKKINTTQT